MAENKESALGGNDETAIANRKLAKEQKDFAVKALQHAVRAHSPFWPRIIAALLGFASLGLLWLPFVALETASGVRSFTFAELLLGRLGSDGSGAAYGTFNYALAALLGILVIGFAVPLVGKRGNRVSLVVSSIFIGLGILGFAIAPSQAILAVGFTPAAFNGAIVPAAGQLEYAQPAVGLGFYLALAAFLLAAFLPYIADAVAKSRGLRSFLWSVKTGKKLLNY